MAWDCYVMCVPSMYKCITSTSTHTLITIYFLSTKFYLFNDKSLAMTFSYFFTMTSTSVLKLTFCHMRVKPILNYLVHMFLVIH